MRNYFQMSMIIASTIMAISAGLLLYHPSATEKNDHPSLPDAFMEEVSALILDKEGNPHLKIITPKMVHYADNDTSHFDTPQVILYRNSPNPWRITANFAKASNGIDRIDCWDNVIIQHTADQSTPNTLIKTPTLTIHPDTQVAETTDSIMLIQPGIVVKSTGMLANMDSGDIKLMSEARGEYVPNAS